MEILVGAIAILLFIIILKIGFKRITIFEFERGLKYSEGKFKEVKQPGQYWYIPFWTHIPKIDIRPRFVTISGQEVLSSDGVTLKVSLAVQSQIIDPDKAINEVENYEQALYLELQLALREIIGNTPIDDVLEKRNEFSQQLMEMTGKKIEDLGLKLLSVDLKDIMFPGQLKQVFAQVVKARKEGQAALEKARGETAALRNLANAAKMIDTNPNLMQLRLIQSLGETSGNTLVLGMPSQSTTIPIKSKEIETSQADQSQDNTKTDTD